MVQFFSPPSKRFLEALLITEGPYCDTDMLKLCIFTQFNVEKGISILDFMKDGFNSKNGK